MTTQGPAPAKHNQPSLPNQPFFSWVRTQTALFIGQIIGLLSVVSIPIALFYYSMHSLPEHFEWQKLEKVGHYVIYAHLLFLVLFIAFLIRRLDKNSVGRYRARLVHEKLKGKRASDNEFADLEVYSTRQVGRFKRRFLWFWCAMLCLYLIFAVEPMFSVPVGDCLEKLTFKQMFRSELFPILSFALNNLSLIFVFCCFSVLYVPLGATPGNSRGPVPTSAEEDPIQTPDAGLPKRTWLRLCGLMRRLVRYLRGQGLDEPERRQRILVVWFIATVVVLTLMFPLIMLSKIGKPTNWSEYPAVFDALSGTINAIVLALLIARLDSKLIGLPSWLICVLYFYAGVQPMFVVFELHPEVYAGIKTAVLWVVFIFKIYFFLIVFYALQTGRVFNYFFCSQVLNDHVKTLKKPLPTGTASQTPPAQTSGEKHAEPVSGVSTEQQKKDEQDVPPAPVPERPRASWFKSLAAGGFFARRKRPPRVAPETSPAVNAEETNAERAVDVSTQQSVKENKQSPPVKAIKEEDTRAIWFLRLGVVAIVIFASSLLVYVSLSGKLKESVDKSPLSTGVVVLHIILLAVILLVILVFVIRDRYRENKRGFLLTNELKFKTASELRFRLSEPMSPEDQNRKFDKLSKRTKDQFKSFTHSFRLFWISLLVLYVAMGVSLTSWPARLDPSGKQKPSEPSPVLSNEAQCLPGTKANFSEVNQGKPQAVDKSETTQIGKWEPSSDSQWPEQRLSINELPRNTIFSFVFFVINNFSVLVLFWCFAVLYIPNDDEKFDERHRLLRRYSLLMWVLLTVLVPLLAVIIKGNGFTPSEAEKIPTILGAVGGTLNAVAFALLIARLDSRIIGLRLPMVTVLYAYASLQPLFVTFNQPSNLLKFIATSAMIAAFLFKICLVLMVGHVRNSGGLIDYLWFFPVLSNSVNSVFGNQFEIRTYSPKPGLFTFSIFNKNIEMYKASDIYPGRAQCDRAIKTLVKAMEKRENYSEPARELQGTYWVQVKSDELLICESVGLSSQTEVDELINESIEKVPYCKYDRG